MQSDTMAALLQLVPMMTIQLLYAWIVHTVCRKQDEHWGWAVATLFPILGLLVFATIMLITLFRTLDRLNALETRLAR